MNSVFMKFGIGGALSGAAVYALGATNPVSLIALAALGQGAAWLPEGIRRCFHRPPAAVNIAPPAPADTAEEIAQRKIAEQDEIALAEAIEASLRTEDQVRNGDFKDEDFEDTGFDCKHSEVLASHVKIPNGLLLHLGEEFCNAAVFFQMLLTQESPKTDPITKLPIENETIEEATKLAGIDADLFLLIWTQALEDHPNGGMTQEEANQACNRRRDRRAQLFVKLLQSIDGTRGQRVNRERFIQYYKLEQWDWWKAALNGQLEA